MLSGRLKDERGFTLVEAAVAGVILAIGILGSIGVFDSSRRESATGERLQVAQALAEAELERMRDVPFAQLATNGAESWPSSGGDGDPANRVVGGGTEFRASNTTSEPLVTADPGTGIDPYSDPDSVTIDGESFDMRVYRFISWRDVECQVAELTQLQDRYIGLLEALSSPLEEIAGNGGRIDRLLAIPLARLPSTVRSRLNVLDPIATSLREAVLDLIDAAEELDEIDPCDADLETLNALDETTSALEPTLDALDSAAANYYSKCFSPLGVPIVCPSTASSHYQALNAQITALQSNDYLGDVEALVDSLGEISSSDHGQNTKRVTVAIVLDPAAGSGPFKPVWATSVVADPEEGLLSG
jgi:type II secretory pathway pseudopilin PulG